MTIRVAKLGEELTGPPGRRVKMGGGDALRIIGHHWASLGIIGHHWASLGIIGGQGIIGGALSGIFFLPHYPSFHSSAILPQFTSLDGNL